MNADNSTTHPGDASRAQQAATLLVVLIPFGGLIAAIIYAWGWGITPLDLSLLLGMYLLTGLGVTVGFHRLFAHRSFVAARPVELLLAVLGSMSAEGPLLKWVAVHRRHHQYSDGENDPHSPHRYGGGLFGVLAGFWHAHMGWMFRADADNLDRYVRDLESDRALRTISRLFLLWVIIGLLLPAAVGGVITGTWTGAWLGLLWGGLVRTFIVHHLTWSINSVCHLWGRRDFRSRDESRNNVICGVLGFGEGWHNNHHAFPASARHGLWWWQVDVSYLVIQALRALGLARHVRKPTREAIAARQIGSIDQV